MISAFPSDFCTDGGRAVINAGAPPINKPSKEELAARPDEPEWLATLPAGVRLVHDFWKNNLKPGGFRLFGTDDQLSGWQARRYRSVLHLAEERPGSIDVGGAERRSPGRWYECSEEGEASRAGTEAAPSDGELKTKEYERELGQAARRTGQVAAMGGAQGPEGLHRVRGARRRRQGRHHQGDHRACQPARVSRHRAARADRAREDRRCTSSAICRTCPPPARS